MSTLVVFIAALVVKLGLSVLERGNTAAGSALRRSTWQAWRFAVEEREAELAELRRQEPPL